MFERRSRRTGVNSASFTTEPDEASAFANPFELMMMGQSTRSDVLEAMFQSVVRQLVHTGDGETLMMERPPSPLSLDEIVGRGYNYPYRQKTEQELLLNLLCPFDNC